MRDNEFVKKGDLLYEIDERPYQYALETALSAQAALEGQIGDEKRRIAAEVSAVSVSRANIHSAEAELANAEQGVNRARAEWTYASNNLHRLEPLLAKQFVTADQVDRARTSEISQAQALRQAESALQLSRAVLKSASAQHEQAGHAVTRTLLRGIRVNSKQELRARIELYLQEVNEEPMVFKWKYKLETLAAESVASP